MLVGYWVIGMPKKIFLIFLLCFSSLIMAKTQHVEILLTKIVAQKTVAEDGDQIFFDIVEYPTECDAKVSRVPSYPMHWLTKELPSLKEVRLWSGMITDDNSVVIVLSLMQQEMPLLVDDLLIGSVRVEISNKQGKLQAEWGQPNYADQPMVDQMRKKPDYVMYGEDSRYIVSFKLKSYIVKNPA